MHNILNKSFEINVTKSEKVVMEVSQHMCICACTLFNPICTVYAHTHTHICVFTVQYSINTTTFCGL
jgi:hypothetical protein